ncbi:MAG: hypothetical protein ACKO23_14235 [Gemmataceae bacterium]
MHSRRWVAVIVFGALTSLAAQYRTKNFVVDAPTVEIAKHIGDWAEYHRKQKAQEWLGQEMPTWGQACPLKVKVTDNGSGGATSFAFDRGSILSIDMKIEGTLERLTYSVLPHEVTHTVFAYHFRCPVPRWADEGGSVFSEDDQERKRHDTLVRQILNTPGRAIPLRRLFGLTQYPRDVMVLYAEGYSVTNFLIGKSNRQDFLNFVADGMRDGWDQAIQSHYQYRNVEELEQAWLQHLRESKQNPASTLVATANGPRGADARPTGRVVSRQTLPPAHPVLGAPRPVAWGVAADDVASALPSASPPDQENLTPSFPSPQATPSSFSAPVPPTQGIQLGAPRSSGMNAPAASSWNRPSSSPSAPPVGSPIGYSP